MRGKQAKRLRRIEKRQSELEIFARSIDRRLVDVELNHCDINDHFRATTKKVPMWARIKAFFK